MRGGGRGDVQRIAGGGGFGDGREDVQLVFLRDFARRFRVRVVNAGEFNRPGSVEFGIDAGVMLTERAGAEDGDFDFCHARSLPVNTAAENENCRRRGDEFQNSKKKFETPHVVSYTRRVPILSYILTALGAYLLGSIPTGFLVAKAKGIDIRNVGSGNIGATNAMRVLGKPAGIFVLLMDAAKGFSACFLGLLIFMYFSMQTSGLHSITDSSSIDFDKMWNAFSNFPILAGIFAVLGHNYTCWLKFKGGKGIATTAGVYLALAPWPLFIALMIFILAVVLTRYISVGSIAAAAALPIMVWIWPPQDIFLGIVTTALGALAIYKHKANIQRLRAGTENRFGQKKESK